jgi:hypothetical protein
MVAQLQNRDEVEGLAYSMTVEASAGPGSNSISCGDFSTYESLGDQSAGHLLVITWRMYRADLPRSLEIGFRLKAKPLFPAIM